MHEVPIRLHDCSLSPAQDRELINLISNGEVRGAVDVEATEQDAVLKAVGADGGAILLDPDGRHAHIAEEPNATIDWGQLDWQHEPA